MSGKKVLRHELAPDEQAGRLDQFLTTLDTTLSRNQARAWIDVGGVHVNGRRVRRCSLALKPGDRLEAFRDQQPLTPFRLQQTHILYQDPYLLAVNKPAGIDTQPTPARYKGTLYEALLQWLHNPNRPLDKPSLGMVQRLDRQTSGILVFSTHVRSHKPLTEQVKQRQLKKSYLALVQGEPEPQGELRGMLARNRRTGLMVTVERGGKEAHCRYRKLEQMAGIALLQVELITGRMHQIRAQFSQQGWPLLGDSAYGGSRQWQGFACERQMLHSWQLGLDHPISREPLHLQAPVPDDILHLLQHAGAAAGKRFQEMMNE
jgi:23S rRNA pseudouridine1911/1915/1917 synthase